MFFKSGQKLTNIKIFFIGPLSVEVKESVLLRPVKSQLDLRNGSDGSDSDDKGMRSFMD